MTIIEKPYGKYLIFAQIGLVFSISLWLRAFYPTLAVHAPHDDFHFIQVASRLGRGEWLGTYDQLTHAKGMFYPLFILINQSTGLPLKISEHILYLLASLLAATVLSRLIGSRWLLVPMFVILAFSPFAWTIENARVIREPLYTSMSVSLFILVALYFRKPSSILLGLVIGLLAAIYWLTREEGIWLMPALAVLFMPWLFNEYKILKSKALPNQLIARLKDFFLPLVSITAPFVLVLLIVATLNYAVYGVFRNNDFRPGTPFTEAYGALSRIQHDVWKRYMIFPFDARQRAYMVSPAARELQSYFEGAPGKSWAKASQRYPYPWGCADTPNNCNDEILSGWFVWALRDAVEKAGHYSSAHAADAYYERLADEINDACESNAIPCRAARNDMTPVWRHHYLADSVSASGDVLKTLMLFPGHPSGIPDSRLTREHRVAFESVINSRVSGHTTIEVATSGSVSKQDVMRKSVSESIAKLYAVASPSMFILALVGYLFLLVAWLRVRAADISTYSIILLTALLAAISSRVGLLGFLEATSIPSNNLLYLSPAIPFYLLFIAASLGLCLQTVRNMASNRKRRPA